jgi:hypothetical protein
LGSPGIKAVRPSSAAKESRFAPSRFVSDYSDASIIRSFGANGIEFYAGTIMYVANTALHQIIQIPVNPDGTAGKASIFITGIKCPRRYCD